MIEWKNCENCNHYDITGQVMCSAHCEKGHQLCPTCVAITAGQPPEAALEVKLGFLRDLSEERKQRLLPHLIARLEVHDITPTTDAVNAALIGYALRMHVEGRMLDNLESEGAFA